MKAIIVEDEKKGREVLLYHLKEYCPDVDVVGQAGTVAESVVLIKKAAPDLVFLDIRLPNELGFSILDYFDPVPFRIICTTADETFGIQAVKAGAIDYLLKPISAKELVQAVEKVKALVSGKQEYLNRKNRTHFEKKLKVPLVSGFLIQEVSAINYCEADGKYTNIYLDTGKKIVSSLNLGEFEKELATKGFVRIHRSFIVNLYKIKQFVKGKSPSIILNSQEELVVSSTYKSQLLTALDNLLYDG